MARNVYIPLLLFIQHWFNFITSAIIKSHNRILANILCKHSVKGASKESGTFRNAVTRYTHYGQCNVFYIALTTVFILPWPQCVYLVNIPEPVQYKIYALALPFDLRCESGTYAVYTTAGTFEDSRDHGIYMYLRV